jgi:uncharacterized membrane protein
MLRLRKPGETYINIDLAERIASVAGGGLLLALSLEERSLPKLATTLPGGVLLYRGLTGHCSVLAQLGINRRYAARLKSVHIHEKVAVDRPRQELYAFWRDVENLPGFMKYLKAVRELDGRLSEWQAHVLGNKGTLTWKSEIVEDRHDAVIAWRSLPGSDIETPGKVRFRDGRGDGSTGVFIVMEYRRSSGERINPAFLQTLKDDVRRFKTLMETGAITSTRIPSSGRSLTREILCVRQL